MAIPTHFTHSWQGFTCSMETHWSTGQSQLCPQDQGCHFQQCSSPIVGSLLPSPRTKTGTYFNFTLLFS